MTLSEFRNRCHGAEDRVFKNGPGFVALCPACDSKSKHLSVAAYGGWLHVHCMAGHGEQDILSAMGLDEQSRNTNDGDSNPKPPSTFYTYHDENGAPLFIKERYYKWKDNEWQKTFAITAPDGGKLYLSNDKKVIPYALPIIGPRIAEGERLWFNEGEKSSELLLSMGEAATNTPYGATDNGLSAAAIKALYPAREIMIVADWDEPGEKYAKKVYSQLAGTGKKVLIVSSATRKPKHDIYDHVIAGYKLDEVIIRHELMPKRGIKTTSYGKDFIPVTASYLVEPYLLKGKAVLLDAKGGVGKSTFSLAWAAAMSRGVHPITFEPLPCGPIKTLYLHKGEDTNKELYTVYLANLGVEGMIRFGGVIDDDFGQAVDDGTYFNPAGLRQVEESILDNGIGLVVVDPLYSFMLGVVNNPNDALSVLPVVGEITRMAARTDCSFIDIRHMRKGSEGDISEHGMGSVAFFNLHRGQLCAEYVSGQPGLVKVVDGRGSIMRKAGPPFYYRKIGNQIEYVTSYHEEEEQE